MWSSAKASVWSGDVAALSAWKPAAFDLRPPAPPPVEAPRDLEAEAYARGYEDGRAAGERDERARVRPAVRAAEEALETINQQDARWTGAAEENLVTLALGIARHIVDREIAVEPDIVRKLVARALATFPIDQPVHVRVHPDDLALLVALRADAPADGWDREDAKLTWVGDTRVTRGGCVLEGRDRIADGRIETALERVYRRLAHQHA